MTAKTLAGTRQLALCAVMAAVMCVIAPVSIPIGPISITGGTFAIYLTACLLGGRWGTLSTLVYLLVGLLGLAGFVGMMVTGIAGFLREGRKNPFACVCGLCLLGYTVNNIFSFQQAMGVAVIFSIFGMGRAFQRMDAGKNIR